MTQLGIFPAIFCINLDSRPDRRAETEAELSRIGLTAERVAATRIEPFNQIALRRLGCKLSHLRVISEANRRGLECILILEDDVTFAPEFIAGARATVEDIKGLEWDLLYFGYESFGYQHGTLAPVTPALATTESMYLAHCYAVHSRAYDTIIRLILDSRLGDTIDGIFVQNANHFRVFCSVPKRAFQRPGFSDIEGHEFLSGR